MIIDYSAHHVTSLSVIKKKPLDKHKEWQATERCQPVQTYRRSIQALLSIPPAEMAKCNPEEFRLFSGKKKMNRPTSALLTHRRLILIKYQTKLRGLGKRTAPAPPMSGTNTRNRQGAPIYNYYPSL